jgi:hypothetical protein
MKLCATVLRVPGRCNDVNFEEGSSMGLCATAGVLRDAFPVRIEMMKAVV